MTNEERTKELNKIFDRESDPHRILAEMNKLGLYRQLEDGSYLKSYVKDGKWVTERSDE